MTTEPPLRVDDRVRWVLPSSGGSYFGTVKSAPNGAKEECVDVNFDHYVNRDVVASIYVNQLTRLPVEPAAQREEAPHPSRWLHERHEQQIAAGNVWNGHGYERRRIPSHPAACLRCGAPAYHGLHAAECSRGALCCAAPPEPEIEVAGPCTRDNREQQWIAMAKGGTEWLHAATPEAAIAAVKRRLREEGF